jgi:hypothetical protein
MPAATATGATRESATTSTAASTPASATTRPASNTRWSPPPSSGTSASPPGGVAGTYYYSLPSAGCVEETVNGQAYIRCTSVYYQEVWSGNEVLYVVVVP